MAPTGAGKTIIFIELINRLLPVMREDECILLVSHLSILTTQTKERIEEFYPHINVGILQGNNLPSKDDKVVISTMQSARNFSKIWEWVDNCGKRPSYIIVDESHRVFCDSYNIIFDTFKEADILCVTASPFKDGKLIHKEFDDIAFEITLHDLIERKRLVPPVLKILGKEIKQTLQRVSIAVAMYEKEENKTPAIFFCPDKKSSKLTRDALKLKGFNAEIILGETSKDKRDKYLKAFINGEIDVLLSVDVLTAGVDLPNCEAIFLIAKTASPTSYIQRVGRGLRPEDKDSVKPHHKKQTCRVYAFREPPTIKHEGIEWVHNHSINPYYKEVNEKNEFERCLNEESRDSDWYKMKNELAHTFKLINSLNYEYIKKLLLERSFPTEFLDMFNKNKEKLKSTQWGERPASNAQKNLLQRNGFKNLTDIKKGEASYLIDTVMQSSGKGQDNSPFTVPSGKYKGRKIWETPHFYRKYVLEKFPNSEVGKMISEFNKNKKR